jgi:hypothetical protein
MIATNPGGKDSSEPNALNGHAWGGSPRHAALRCAPRGEHARHAEVPRRPSRAAGALLEGWALNVSKGGIRVILEEKVEPGEEFEVELLNPNAAAGGEGPAIEGAQVGCIVWVQEESDGVVAGIAFKKC